MLHAAVYFSIVAEDLVNAQSDNRVNARSSLGWNPDCSDCGPNKQDTAGEHRRRIAGAYAEQVGSKKAIQYQCECEPNAESHEDEFRSLGKAPTKVQKEYRRANCKRRSCDRTAGFWFEILPNSESVIPISGFP